MAVEMIQGRAGVQPEAKPVEARPAEAARPVTIEAVTDAKPIVMEKEQGSRQAPLEDGAQAQEKQPTEKQIKSAMSQANSRLRRTGCQFSYDEDIHRISIKIIDKDTQEVIKEIPPEETLEMVEKMWELAGLLVDERR